MFFWSIVSGCFRAHEEIVINQRSYFIRKQIGEGAFSYVYLAYEKRSRKPYAIKRVICHGQADDQIVLREIKIHELVGRHPNVLLCEGYSVADITAFDKAYYERQAADISGKEYNILLPYFRRGTLQDELNWRRVSGDFIAEARVLKLFRGVCNGTKALHDLKPERYAHRDLKPANVLLDDSDNAVIMDLGSAQPARIEIKDESQARAILDYIEEHCSVYYRPPEFFALRSGDAIDERSDIWSLGCTLYALCFLESPFESLYERGDSLALAIMSGHVKIPAHSKYSDQVHSLINKLLQVDKQKRPYVSEVLDDLAKCVSPSPQ